MNASSLEQIIEAVLYEGYVLYPYRPSSKKNCRERFTFGRVYPEAYSVDQRGAEPCVMQTECLVRAASAAPRVRISVRFLHPIARETGQFEKLFSTGSTETEPGFRLVPESRAGEQSLQSWQEAAERTVLLPEISPADQSPVSIRIPFLFPATHDLEPMRDGENAFGIVSRRLDALEGAVEATLLSLGGGLFKISVKIANLTPVPPEALRNTEAVLLRTFASTHTVLNLEGGEFLSLMDPPADAKTAASECRNVGTWPVLVGDEARGERDTMLSSPIVLYDYPKIAPESAGSLFDATEIDELLTLRILTLTDQEKVEMAHTEERVRKLLERTETLPKEALLRMHGALRQAPERAAVEFDDFFGAATRLNGVEVDGVYLRPGDRVRIRPKAQADVMDLALDGQTAIIEAVEQDLEKRVLLAVVLDKDPGKDLGLMRQPGHRFFFRPDEVEPLPGGEP